MEQLPRFLFALISGLAAGGVAHLALLACGQWLIPLPPGFKSSPAVAVATLLDARHFIFPFLAHALGTCVGAAVAWSVASTRRDVVGYAVGATFLIGGITAARLASVPWWFIALDLPLAYFPMAWLGNRLGLRLWLARA